MKRVVAVLLLLLAAGVLLLFVALTYGLTSEYDFTPGRLQPVDVVIVLLLGCVALLMLLGARACLDARRPKTVPLAIAVLTAFGGAGAASAVLGGAAHDRRDAVIANACSPQEREVLAAVDFPGFRLGPLGDPNGGCVLRLSPQTAAATAVADLTTTLEHEGWRTSERDIDAVTLQRDGLVLLMTTVSDDKTSELVLMLR